MPFAEWLHEHRLLTVLAFVPVVFFLGMHRRRGTKPNANAMPERGDKPRMCGLPAGGVHRVLVTGSNSGLGLDTARQLADNHSDATEIILAVRSRAKGEGAIVELVKLTGRPASLFSILVVSVGDMGSAKAAAREVSGPLDGVVLNAGGMSGGVNKDPETGVLIQFNVNTLGHAIFLEELIRLGKLTPNAHVVFVGSFAARGVTMMGLPFPEYGPATPDAIADIITGTAVSPLTVETVYGYAKSIMALYVSALARRHPEYAIFTVSPGSTTGTDGAKYAPLWARIVLKILGPWVLVPLGVMHTKEKGAARFVEVLLGTHFTSGLYLGSTFNKMTGPLEDQAQHYPIFGDEAYQEAAFEAVHRFM